RRAGARHRASGERGARRDRAKARELRSASGVSRGARHERLGAVSRCRAHRSRVGGARPARRVRRCRGHRLSRFGAGRTSGRGRADLRGAGSLCEPITAPDIMPFRTRINKEGPVGSVSAQTTQVGAPKAARRPKISKDLPGPLAAALVARDQGALSTSFTRPYPLVIAKGEGVWVQDVDGNEFLDFTAGIAVAATGHSHPKVVEAIEKQARLFIHMSGTDFYYEPEIRLAERLRDSAPVAAPARVFFANSGAETIEGAMKLARWSTRRTHFLAFTGAFHGRTMGAL